MKTLRDHIYGLRRQPAPFIFSEESVLSSASAFIGTRYWVRLFREAGARPGDRVLYAGDYCQGFLYLLLAGFWENLTIILKGPGTDMSAAIREFDPQFVFTHQEEPEREFLSLGRTPLPAGLRRRATRDQFAPDHRARLILNSAGSLGQPKNIVLSETNLIAILHSHSPEFGYAEETALSVLPLTHAFGLVIDFLPHLFAGSTIVRAPDNGRDIPRLLDLARSFSVTSMAMVPRTLEGILANDGADVLRGLSHGIIGGAPIPVPYFPFLRGTRLRVGYGQTEASPGITLGEPGRFESYYVGRPVGCRLDFSSTGELLYRGPNQCYGFFTDAGIEPNRAVWQSSRDRGFLRDGQVFITGRMDSARKAGNGKFYSVFEKEVRGA